jgi:hypothetical protein
MNDFNDWASYLLRAEMSMRMLNDKLLHKQYEGIDRLVDSIIDDLIKTKLWAAHETNKIE